MATNWLSNLFSSPNATQPAPRGVGPQGQNWLSSFKETAAPIAQDMAGGLNEALQDPNVLRFMAELGTSIDPEGAGGAIGRPTTEMIRREAQPNFMENLIKALGEGGQVKIKPDGGIDMKSGSPSAESGKKEESGLGTLEESNVTDQEQGSGESDPLDSFLDDMLNNFMGGLGNAK